MKTYTLVAYKPNSIDTCRGCTMAEYESDEKFARGLSRIEAVQAVSELLAAARGQGEARWQVRLFGDAPVDFDNTDTLGEEGVLPDDMHTEIEAARTRIIAEREATRLAAAQRKAKCDGEIQLASDLAELARLKAKLSEQHRPPT